MRIQLYKNQNNHTLNEIIHNANKITHPHTKATEVKLTLAQQQGTAYSEMSTPV